MKDTNNIDLKINGMMTLPGGTFNSIKINGRLTFAGDFTCTDLLVNGLMTTEGTAKAAKVKINGSANFNKDVEFDSMNVMGKSLIDGNLKINELKVEGQVRISKSLSADSVNLTGMLNVNENLNSETFKTKGSFTVDGMLNSGDIEIELYGKSSANEIGGEKIRVCKGSKNYINKLIKSLFSSFNFFDIKLVTNVIEGDEIYLEYTKAKIVRGDRIEIGPGCEIESVEFKNAFSKHESSTVKDNKKI